MMPLNKKSKIKNQKCQAGFTVLEMIVATSIALIIFLVGFTLISGTSDTRTQSMARVRMTENARLLFQLLERDLAGAYDVGSFTLTSGNVGNVIMPNVDGFNDALQFCTKLDTSNMTNQCVLVQYYVNPATSAHSPQNVLCRNVILVPSIKNPALPPPTPLTTDPAYALFDMVYGPTAAIVPTMNYRFKIVGQRWDPIGKTFVSPAPAQPPYTHLQVTLILQYNDTNQSGQLQGTRPPVQNTFSKFIAIPAGFQ